MKCLHLRPTAIYVPTFSRFFFRVYCHSPEWRTLMRLAKRLYFSIFSEDLQYPTTDRLRIFCYYPSIMYTEWRNFIKLVINIVCTNGAGVRSNICSPVVIRVTHASDILCVGYTRTLWHLLHVICSGFWACIYGMLWPLTRSSMQKQREVLKRRQSHIVFHFSITHNMKFSTLFFTATIVSAAVARPIQTGVDSGVLLDNNSTEYPHLLGTPTFLLID